MIKLQILNQKREYQNANPISGIGTLDFCFRI